MLNIKFKKYIVLLFILSTCFVISGVNVHAKENKSKVKISSIADSEIRSQIKKKDKNKDGYLSDKELKKVTGVWTESDCGPINLKGIEKLKYLKSIDIDKGGKIKNFENIYKLKNLEGLRIQQSSVKKLKLGSLKKLKYLDVILCNTKTIDISENKELLWVTIWGTKIKKLDLSNCKKLEQLEVRCDDLKELNLKNNKKLKNLSYTSVSKISSLKYNKKLTKLSVGYTNMPKLSKHTKARIKELRLEGVDIKTLKINKNFKNLKKVSIFRGELGKIIVSKCPKLKTLDIWGEDIKNISVSQCPRLKTLDIAFGNNIEKLSVLNCKKLNSFIVHDCNILNLSCNNNLLLKYIDIIRCNINNIYYEEERYAVAR